MDGPYQQLIEIASNLETYDSHEALTRALDELEFVHELLAPEQQDLANQLMERLNARLHRLHASKKDDVEN
jgi:hypothetical protein